MLPVKDVSGLLYGYLGRSLEPDKSEVPKYLFPKNLPKSRFLFGAHEIQAGTFGPAPLKRVYLVESPFCVMKFAMYGLPAVAAYGWSVSPEQCELLRSITRGVVYLPDANKSAEAPRVASELAAHLWLRLPPLPGSISDPEQMTREQLLAL